MCASFDGTRDVLARLARRKRKVASAILDVGSQSRKTAIDLPALPVRNRACGGNAEQRMDEAQPAVVFDDHAIIERRVDGTIDLLDVAVQCSGDERTARRAQQRDRH